MRLRHTLLLLPLVLAACDSAQTCGDAGNCIASPATLYVGNQGNFADNNGTITRYDLAEDVATQDAVRLPDGSPLVGLVQALAFGPSDRLYVLQNLSTGGGRLDVVDPETNRVVAQVPLADPRGIAFVGTRAYVTSLFDGTVTPVDLATNTVGTPIPVGSNPEGVLYADGRIVVANNGFGADSTITVIDPTTNAVVATRDVGCDGPRHLGADGEGEVWVFCTGRTDFSTGATTNGAVVIYDGPTGAEVARIALDGQISTASLGQDVAFPGDGFAWAVLDAGRLARFNTSTNTLGGVTTPEVPASHLIGAVGYDSVSERLFVAAVPNDFVSAGQVVEVNPATGARLGGFAAGLIPSALAFRPVVVED